MALNQLGNFEFDSFHRVENRGAPPSILAEQCEILQRPGYAGTAIIRMGTKESPFQMRSVVGCTNQLAAMTLAKLYKDAQGQGPYGIIWGGLDFVGAYDVVYVPLQVDIVRACRLSASAGGIYSPCYGLLEAIWTLQPVAVPEGA